MASPYGTAAVATFAARSGGVAATDPTLLKRRTIDAAVADAWKRRPYAPLRPATVAAGWRLGYAAEAWRAGEFRRVDRGPFAVRRKGAGAAGDVVVLYDGLGLRYGAGLRVPAGFGLVCCQAPELCDGGRGASAGPLDGRAARDAGLLAAELTPPALLVGYSFGGVLAPYLRDALAARGAATRGALLVDPLPWGSSPRDDPRDPDPLRAAAGCYDVLVARLGYGAAPALRAAVDAGDVNSLPALGAELRRFLGTAAAFEEVDRVARFLDACDTACAWDFTLGAAVFVTTAGGPAHFAARNRPNRAHGDGVYGWSAAAPNARRAAVLAGGHFDAFRGAGNLRALAAALEELVSEG